MYIDIHTHQTSSGADQSLLQWNLPADFSGEETPVPERPQSGTWSVGVHPGDIQVDHWKAQLAWVFRAIQYPTVLAVGECGLDRLVSIPRSIQEEVFIQHLKWAMDVRKPVIVHCVKAFDELLAIQKVWKPSIPVLVHGFHKHVQVAEALFKRGFFISLDDRIPLSLSREVLIQYQDQILLETDAGPVSIQKVYENFAERIGWTVAQVQTKMEENYLIFTKSL